MGKRRRGNGKGNDRRKKYKLSSGIIDPGVSGVYATCPRNREQKCADELMALFEEKLDEYGIKEVKDEENEDKEEGEDAEGKENKDGKECAEKKEESIEDAMKAELAQLQESSKKKTKSTHPLLKAIMLNQECLVFIKFKKPIDAEDFVHRVLSDLYESGERRTRFVLKLTPVQSTCSASEEELRKMATKALAKHFHKEKDQKPHKFAISVTKRSFNTFERLFLIKTVAECMGHDHGHQVDLKAYDKWISIECFKNNIGIGVLDDYDKFFKYNVDKIYENRAKVDTVSRVTEE